MNANAEARKIFKYVNASKTKPSCTKIFDLVRENNPESHIPHPPIIQNDNKTHFEIPRKNHVNQRTIPSDYMKSIPHINQYQTMQGNNMIDYFNFMRSIPIPNKLLENQNLFFEKAMSNINNQIMETMHLRANLYNKSSLVELMYSFLYNSPNPIRNRETYNQFADNLCEKAPVLNNIVIYSVILY